MSSFTDGSCMVTFSGDHGGTYITSCDTVEFIDDHLRNTGTTSIYLYPEFRTSNTDQNYIVIPVSSYPYWYNNTSYNRAYITNASDVSFNARSYYYREKGYVDILVMLIVSLYALLHLVRG